MAGQGKREAVRRRGRAWSHCLALGTCLVLSATAAEGPVAPASAMLDVAQAVELHRSGVADAMRRIDAAQARGEAVPERLLRIRALEPVLSWGLVAADGSMVALLPGSRDSVWAMVLGPEQVLASGHLPTLMVLELDGLDVIRIRPDRITPDWSAILLVHELSHVVDQRAGTYGDEPDCHREFEAYVVERQYYDLAHGGRLSRELDRMIAALGLRGPDDAIDLAQARRLGDAVAELERNLGEPAAASDAELEMRDGFYYVSLVDRLGERSQADAASRCASMARAIAAAGKY